MVGSFQPFRLRLDPLLRLFWRVSGAPIFLAQRADSLRSPHARRREERLEASSLDSFGGVHGSCCSGCVLRSTPYKRSKRSWILRSRSIQNHWECRLWLLSMWFHATFMPIFLDIYQFTDDRGYLFQSDQIKLKSNIVHQDILYIINHFHRRQSVAS